MKNPFFQISALMLTIALSALCLSCGDEEPNTIVEDPVLTVEPSTGDIVFSANGVVTTGQALFTVETNQNKWYAIPDNGWVKVSKSDNFFTLSADTHTALTTRSARVNVMAGNAPPFVINVQQTGQPHSLTVMPTDRIINFPEAGGARTFTVTTNVGTWTVSSDKTWATVSKVNNTFIISAEANTDMTAPEDATVTVTAGDAPPVTITVKQAAASGILIPTELYLYGTATTPDVGGGQKFRRLSNGIFVIYTKLAAGNLCFRNSTGATAKNYYFDSGAIVQKEGSMTITATDLSGYWIAERITINFNTSTMTREKIGDMHVIWAQTRCDMGPYSTGSRDNALRMIYAGNGVFQRVISKINVPYQHSAWGATTTTDNRFNFFLQIQNDVDNNWYQWCSYQDWPSGPPADDAPLSNFTMVEVKNAGQWFQNFKISPTKVNAENVTVKVYTNNNNLMYYAFE